ncbi:hypothetical protein V5O48_018810 [Marasmius crinis-equi]|uniref:Uncharacterized protein n=1 Tax=Marasmius crinis-equi TaxID=585013 RepID=A0ABR3EK62_9AGAR
MTTCSANRALVIHALVVMEAFALQLAEQRVRWREVHFVIDEQLFRAQSGVFGCTVFPILEKITLITCSLDTYSGVRPSPAFVDTNGDLTKTLDLSRCPSLTHTALGASLQVTVSVTLPNAHITHLEIDNNGLPIINFGRSPPVTEVQGLPFPNLVWLHVIDGDETLQAINAPKLQHLVLSLVYGYGATGVLDLWKRSKCAIRTLEFRVPCLVTILSHYTVFDVLDHIGYGLRKLCFSVVRMDSLRELKWPHFDFLLRRSVRYIEIRVRANVAVDRLLPSAHLPPIFDCSTWADRGKHITRYEWWAFDAHTTQFLDMVKNLDELEVLVLDCDRSVYRDRYHSPRVQQMNLWRRGPTHHIRLLLKDDGDHSELVVQGGLLD